MKEQVNSTTAAIVIGVIVVLLVGFGVYKMQSGKTTATSDSQGTQQMMEKMGQDYGGKSGRRPPPGTAGNPMGGSQGGGMPVYPGR